MTGDAGGRSAGGGTAAARVGTKGSTLHDIHQALTGEPRMRQAVAGSLALTFARQGLEGATW